VQHVKSLRLKQLEVVSSFCSGRDMFVSLPTGYGKSITYATLPLVFDKIRELCGHDVKLFKFYRKAQKHCCKYKPSFSYCIMVDKKEKFSALGWNVEFVGEAQTDKTTFGRVISGEAQLPYISPENMINNSVYCKMLLTSACKENY